jgi:molecular chaperone GrpE
MTWEHGSERPEAEGTPERVAAEGAAQAAESAVGADDLARLSVEDLRRKVREAQEDAARNWQHFLHSAADLENYKKQAARERQDAVERTRRQMLGLVLGVVDNLERALAFGEAPEGAARALVDGLRMAHRQILDQLAAVGVLPVEAVGKPFDPRLHEVVSIVAPDQAGQAAGTVIRELLKGYLYNGDVLRPAKVVVVAERPGGESGRQPETQAGDQGR